MKKTLLTALSIIGLLSPFLATSQTFSPQTHTVTYTIGSGASIFDPIRNNTSNPITLKWQVIGTTFPDDWLTAGAFGICDNQTCYYNGHSTITGSTMQLYNYTNDSADVFTSNPYSADTTGPFSLALNLPLTETGTHTVTVRVWQDLGTTDTIVFVINKVPAAVPNVTPNPSDVLLYPNPANNEVNVVFNENADIRNIAVYNIIGKVMTVYKVSGSSANMSIDNMPSGIYFVRLYNGQGNVVATRKFTKQ